MYNTILHFIEKDISEIEKITGKILTGEADSNDLSEEIHNRVLKLGRNLVAELYEKLDEESYSIYSEGIEIEIDTEEAYRRQGLATICAARLILECLRRGKYPSWDAANKESVALAEKLGYELAYEYVTYEIETVQSRFLIDFI